MRENLLENFNTGFLNKLDSVSRFLYRKRHTISLKSAKDFNLYRPMDIYYTIICYVQVKNIYILIIIIMSHANLLAIFI